jgi:hypothetical protein
MSDEPTLESQQRLARAFERLGPLLKQIGENRGQPGRLRELVRQPTHRPADWFDVLASQHEFLILMAEGIVDLQHELADLKLDLGTNDDDDEDEPF